MAVKRVNVVQEARMTCGMSGRSVGVGRALNFRLLEHLTLASTVERDLREWPSAQRFPAFC
jgi:hypothetical protein